MELSRDGDYYILSLKNNENRLNPEFCGLFDKNLTVVQESSAKGLLITGDDKFFCNGLDLNWVSKQSNGNEALKELGIASTSLMTRLLLFPIPTVALLNGHAFAAGFVLAMCCDWRVMRDDKGFLCAPEIDLGMPFNSTMSLFLAKIDKRALRETLIEGKRWKAQEALEVGLVDAVADKGGLITVGKNLIRPAMNKERKIMYLIKKDLYGEVAREMRSNPIISAKL